MKYGLTYLRRIACRISFWAGVTLQHIRSDGIGEPYWLAANGGRTEGGDERIDRALVTQDAKGIDDCVRTVIRRMSGLPGARGNKSVFVNPSFGRAWWRERIVARILKRDGVEDRAALLDVVRVKSAILGKSGHYDCVQRISVFGSSRCTGRFRQQLGEAP